MMQPNGPNPAVAATVTRTGYQNFGSFFTENVEDLIAIPKEQYVAPELPFSRPLLEDVATCGFGEPCRKLFMIDFEKWTFANHGAFGAVCRAAHQEANLWRKHAEAQPLRFLDRELFPHMVRVMREMADFIGADPRDLVFVPNATTGLNVAIQAAGLRPGDTLYMLNIGYGSVKKMAQAASAAAAGQGAGTSAATTSGEAPGGINVVYGEVKFPISSPQDIVDLVAATLPPATRLAVFDAVTSNTALLLPVEELTALCHSRGVQVLVDGAHALGQLHLNLRAGVCGGCGGGAGAGLCGGSCSSGGPADEEEPKEEQNLERDGKQGRGSTRQPQGRGPQQRHPDRAAAAAAAAHPAQPSSWSPSSSVPDYFVTNCHKWLCAPRGSAVLWVAPHAQPCVRPLVVSHGSGCGFTSDFIWDGCRDYAPYLATSSALLLWRALGPARIRTYCRDLLAAAVELLRGRWGGEGSGAAAGGGGGGLLAPSLDMCACMALVELPKGLAESEPANSTDAKYVQDLLHHVHSVECPVKCIQGALYVRISVHIYNTLQDYERLAEAVQHIVAAAAAGGTAAATSGADIAAATACNAEAATAASATAGASEGAMAAAAASQSTAAAEGP